MKKKIAITIGIPAYNEEKNIGFLLKALRMQKLDGLRVKEVIVVSDGSDDNTVNVITSTHTPYLKLLIRKTRQGINKNLNQIIRLATGDILVILNADVLPEGDNFLQQLSRPIIKDKTVGLVGGAVIAIPPKSIFEKIIYRSHELKVRIGEEINEGNNVYMCYGGNRALSRDFYSKLQFPDNCPEDAYSYFYCIQKGFKFVFQKGAKIKIRLPATFKDHAKQSIRFSAGKRKLEKFFGKALIDKAYQIPLKIYIESIFRFLLKDPFSTAAYILITMILRKSKPQERFNSNWEVAKSTKSLS